MDPDDEKPFPSGISAIANRAIAGAEYFVGADPGEGSGTTLSAEDNNFSAVTEGMEELSLDVSGLAGGLHRVGTRFRDDLGNWSPVAFHDLFVFDLALVDAQPEAEPQIDFLAIDQAPTAGSSVSVSLGGTSYSYQAQAGDDLNATRTGLLAALQSNPIADAELLADGRIRLTGKTAGQAHALTTSGGLSIDAADDSRDTFPATIPEAPTNRAIVGAEYFVDVDPGEGSGTALSAEDNNFSAVTEGMEELALDVSGLAGGLHRVGTRFRDDLGNWSPVAFHDLFVFDLALVDAQPEAEPQIDFLAIDQAPAAGSSVSVSLGGTSYSYQAQAGDDVNATRTGLLAALQSNPIADAELLADGRIRLTGKTAGQAHALTTSGGISIDAANDSRDTFPATIPEAPTNRAIAGAEYFVGADPGEGSGTALSAEDNNFSAVTEGMEELALDVSGLAGGLHRVGTRFRDDLGNWSPVAFHDLFVFDLALVDAQPEAEPQVDFLAIDQAPTAGSSVSVSLGGTSYSYQTQAGDDLNATRTGLLAALQSNPIADAELLADGRIRLTGKTAGQAHALTTSGGISIDAANDSRDTFPATIPEAPTNRAIVGAEYFVGADPGEGSGTALSAEDNNFSAVTEGMEELSLDVSGLAGGLHRVGTRFRDDLGNWSPVAFHDLFVFDLALVDAQPEAEPQVDFLAIDQAPTAGSSVSVSLGGTSYSYQTQAGDDLNATRTGLLAALQSNPIADAELLADGRIRLTGKTAGQAHALTTSGGVSLDAADDSRDTFPATIPEAPTNRAIAGAEYFVGADPGEGSGTALSAEDNNFSAVTESMAELTLDVSGLAGGLHRVGTRFRDDLGNWSPVAFHDLFVFDLALVDAQPEAEPQIDFLTLDQLPATGTVVTVALAGTNLLFLRGASGRRRERNVRERPARPPSPEQPDRLRRSPGRWSHTAYEPSVRRFT